MIDKEKLIAIISSVSNEFQWVEHANPLTIQILANNLVPIARELQTNPSTYFDQLSCITGIDNGPEVNTMEVIYTLYSIPFNHSLNIKVVLDRKNPEVDSISSIWKSANWLEREAFDMYGTNFLNHPDLRRILMPADWEGFPLRKDYKELDSYRNIKLKDDN